MKSRTCYTPILTGATLFLGASLFWACSSTRAAQQHPDEVDSVARTFMTNGFGAVNVSQDRTRGVMTLTGDVQSQERKTYAAQIAHLNAGDYLIADEITVTPPRPTMAKRTVDGYKAVLRAHQSLHPRDIHYEAKNGTFILSGSVHTAQERAEAVELAEAGPHVERVVDEIKVDRQRD